MTVPNKNRPLPAQVLVAIVNRYVVFEQEAALPTVSAFEPATLPELLPRLGGEHDREVEQRLVESVLVQDARLIREPESTLNADFRVEYVDGSEYLVDVKVVSDRLRSREMDLAWRRSREAREQGLSLQTWMFDIENLKLHILGPDISHNEMVPRDVWERTGDELFTRADVVREVDEWEGRLRNLLAGTANRCIISSDIVTLRVRSQLRPSRTGWSQFEYLARKASSELIEENAREKAIQRHAWRYMKDNIKSVTVRKRLDLIFNGNQLVLDNLYKDYELRNDIAHNYKRLPAEVRDLEEWLEHLEDLVNKF